MGIATTNHQELERLASTARTLGHLMQDALNIPATKEDFERWYKELSDFVHRVGNEDLIYILKKYDLNLEKPHPNILVEYEYSVLFSYYVGAIEEMRMHLQKLKAITRTYNEHVDANGNKELIVGEYLTGERIVQLTPSKDPNVVEASKRVDKLNEVLKLYYDKKRVVDSETKTPLVYKLHLAEDIK